MAYTVPPRWSHGDYPTAANINKYKDALDAIYALSGSKELNFAVLGNANTDKGYYFINAYRWLHYVGDGEIVDPTGAGETITISGDGSTVQVYDLTQVDWIHEGKLYEVKDVAYVLEDFEP